MIAPTPVWGIKVKTGPLSLGRALTGVLQAEARLAQLHRRGIILSQCYPMLPENGVACS